MPFSFKEWYELNGKRLNELRRSRYQSDAGYRDKVLKTNQVSRQNHKKPSAKPRKTAKGGPKTTRSIEIDGVMVELFTIGGLAAKLGCSIQAIRLWEKQGIIPSTPYRSGPSRDGDRLYSKEQLEEIRTILKARGREAAASKKEGSAFSRAFVRYIRFPDGSVSKVTLFLIGALAEALGRKVTSVEQLESRGVIPPTPFRATSVGRRLFSADMISAVKAILSEKKWDFRNEANVKWVHDHIVEVWTAQQVMDAVLVEAVSDERSANVEEART